MAEDRSFPEQPVHEPYALTWSVSGMSGTLAECSCRRCHTLSCSQATDPYQVPPAINLISVSYLNSIGF
jgi:hypothetical protein